MSLLLFIRSPEIYIYIYIYLYIYILYVRIVNILYTYIFIYICKCVCIKHVCIHQEEDSDFLLPLLFHMYVYIYIICIYCINILYTYIYLYTHIHVCIYIPEDEDLDSLLPPLFLASFKLFLAISTAPIYIWMYIHI
jgi:hypothetical protein